MEKINKINKAVSKYFFIPIAVETLGSESTFKKSNTCGVSNNRLYNKRRWCELSVGIRSKNRTVNAQWRNSRLRTLSKEFQLQSSVEMRLRFAGYLFEERGTGTATDNDSVEKQTDNIELIKPITESLYQ